MEIRSARKDAEWMFLKALLGLLDRHLADRIRSINIQFG